MSVFVSVFSFTISLRVPCPCVHACNPHVGHSGDILSRPIRSTWLITQAQSFNSLTDKLFLKPEGSLLQPVQYSDIFPIWNTAPWGVYRKMKNYENSLPSPSFWQCELWRPLWTKTDDPEWSDSESLTSTDMPVSSSQPWCSPQHGMHRNALWFSGLTTQDMNQLAHLTFTHKMIGKVCACVQTGEQI